MKTLYKYRPYSARSLEILIKKELYFASPEQLNDPYDCQLSVVDSLLAAIEIAKNENIQVYTRLEKLISARGMLESICNDISNAGVISFSRSPNIVLMWSHYAHEHKGFALGFELSEKFTTHKNTEQIIGSANVFYSKSNPIPEFLADYMPKAGPSDYEDFWTKLIGIGLLVKSASWRYEKEVRVLRKSNGVVSFEPSELREVIFGLNMPESEQSVIRTLLSGPEWNHIRYRKVIRTTGFSLKIVSAQ